MKISLKKTHLLVGLAGVVIFLLSGQYMNYYLPEMHLEGHDRLRFSIRANHIYILLAALLNLSLGSYLRMSAVRWRAALQTTGSLLVLSALGLLVYAFFYETKAGLDRPITLWAMIAALAGTSLHALSGVKHGSASERPRGVAAQPTAGVGRGAGA